MRDTRFEKVVLFGLLIIGGTVLAHTLQETNAVVRSMLRQSWEYSLQLSHGDWSVLNWPAKPDTWQGFLRLGENNGWLPEEKEAAFDWYLNSMAQRDFLEIPKGTLNMLSVAVAECKEHGHTNAFPALRLLAEKANGKFREEAISAAIKCAPVDASLVEFVSSVATNSVASTPWERVLALIGLKERLATNTVDAATLDSATRTFYRCREDGYSSVCCDSVLTNRIDGYALSSNRLQVACHMLSLTNMKARFTAYHVNVTNQLLSSGQPLRWVTIGGEGDE